MGDHFLLDLYQCDADKLDDEQLIKKHLIENGDEEPFELIRWRNKLNVKNKFNIKTKKKSILKQHEIYRIAFNAGKLEGIKSIKNKNK